MTKHPEYRVIVATGAIGILSPAGGTIVFYIDRIEPKSDTMGKISLQSINRELQTELIMSPATFKAVADWMTLQVKEFEEQQKQQITPAKMEQPAGKYA
jgi:hypothetical protein